LVVTGADSGDTVTTGNRSSGTPAAAAVPAQIRRIAATICPITFWSKLRRVSSSRTSSGMMFRLVPP
jgi:hypothetical protein